MPQLDGLRAIAVLAVFVQHFLPRFANYLPGSIGVNAFFLLSGFLITGILLRCRDDCERLGEPKWFALRQFYIRRFLRIFPLYYVVLVLVFVAFPELRAGWKWYVAYLPNYHVIQRDAWQPAISHFWTLGVEEQFYLAWPWLVMFTPRRSIKPIMALCIAVGITWKIAAYLLTKSFLISVLPVFACLDTLGAGSLLAVVGTRRHLSALKWLGLPALIAVPFVHRLTPAAPWGHVLVAAGVCCSGAWLVASASRGFTGPLGRLLASKPATYLGAISYGLYVWHLPIGFALTRSSVPLSPIKEFVVVSVMTVAIASVSWFVFERPINALKRYVSYVGRVTPAARTSAVVPEAAVSSPSPGASD